MRPTPLIAILTLALGLAVPASAQLLNLPLDGDQPVLVFDNQGSTVFGGGSALLPKGAVARSAVLV